MKFGMISGLLWGLDTVILGIALALFPVSDTSLAASTIAIAGAFLHDAVCALWLVGYMGIRKRLGATLLALNTRSGLVVMVGALLGGPLGMTGYVVAINNIGAGYTAIISACYPALGAALSFIILKERMQPGQIGALFVALLGVMGVGFISSGDSTLTNPALGLFGALLAVVGWGSEAVLCAWGMRDDAVDDDTALQIRETTSAMAYAVIVVPLFGAWGLSTSVLPYTAMACIAASALAGTASYLCYYKGIALLGASHAMALNISYSAWAVVCSFVLLGEVPSVATVLLCIVILAGTILAASDWHELFPTSQK